MTVTTLVLIMPEQSTDTQPQSPDPADVDNEQPPLTFWQLLGSTGAAFFGVQSSRNRKRDFSRGKASHFILMGVGLTIVFVLLMAGLVNLILRLI